MRLIRQQEHFDCGIALVAMLARCSYADALDVYKGPWHMTRGLRWQRLCRMLYALTGHRWTTRSLFDASGGPLFCPSSLEAAIPNGWFGFDSPLGVLVYKPNTKDSHWVGLSNHWVYDPAAVKRQGWADSPLRQWRVVRVILKSAA